MDFNGQISRIRMRAFLLFRSHAVHQMLAGARLSVKPLLAGSRHRLLITRAMATQVCACNALAVLLAVPCDGALASSSWQDKPPSSRFILHPLTQALHEVCAVLVI